MAFQIRFNEEKNQLLKATRGVCFDDAVEAINGDRVLEDVEHPSPKFPHQRIYRVLIKKYVYAIPYVLNKEKKEIFLKTIYPSRVLTKKYKIGGKL